jgi:hypothetical protein
MTTTRTHARSLIAAVLAAIATAVLIGIPTDVVPNPWFSRQIPVRPLDVVVLVALSVLTGALVATYTLAGGALAIRVRAIRRGSCPLPALRRSM